MTRSCFSDVPDVAGNLIRIRERVRTAAASCGRRAEDIALMAVTKTVPPEWVNQALREGVALLGENRVQECCEKYQSYCCGREQIHFIGHLQTNKIRVIIDKVSMVESVDTLHLAAALQKECARRGMEMDILLQVNIGAEPTKSGFPAEEIWEAYQEISASCSRLRVRGLMAIPPNLPGDRYFGRMEELYQRLRTDASPGRTPDILSMGMSGDFERAIRFGSTQIRLGRALFGERTPVGQGQTGRECREDRKAE